MWHSSLFPCTWCYAMKDKLDKWGALRTISNCEENFTKWLQAEAVKSFKVKSALKIVSIHRLLEALFVSLFWIITPPELHLMLDVVNRYTLHTYYG
jgi:hypothetical protein